MNDYSRGKIISSVNWNFINTISQTILNFGVGVVLARILNPVDFGLYGLATIFFGFLNLLFTASISRFIIYKKNLDTDDINTSFTISIVLSLLSYVIIWFSAPLLASFFDEKSLIELIRIYTITIFFFSVSSILKGLHIKRLNFKIVFYCDTISMIFGYSTVGILLALNNYGVLSLVYASLVKEMLLLTALLSISRIKLSFKFIFEKMKNIFYYSSGVGLSNFFGYTSNNADYVIIGKFLDSNALGLYTRAFSIMTLPLSKISMTIYDVIFSVFSNAENNLEKIRNIYLKTVKIIALVAFPLLSTMIIGSELIINGIYGEKWSGAIRVLQILCISGFFRVTTNSAGAVAKATGKVYSEAWIQMIYAIVLITGAIFGVRYGIEGVGLAVVISSLWLYLAMGQLALATLKVKWSEFLKAHLPGVVILLAITAVNLITLSGVHYFLSSEKYILKLCILLFISLLMMFLLLKTLPVKLVGEEGRNILSEYLNKFNFLSGKNI